MPEQHFQPIEAYDVDPTDRDTLGRIMFAAGKGDQRAKMTLRRIAGGKTGDAQRVADQALHTSD